MKILMIDALGSLGQAYYDLHLCENLARLNGKNIRLEVPIDYEYNTSFFTIVSSSRHMEKQLGKVSRIRQYVKWLKEVASQARQWQPDIIHWQFGFFCFFDYLTTQYLKSALPQARVVITLHDARPVKPTWNNIIARRRFFRTANGLIAHSEEALADYWHWIKKISSAVHAKIIPHGPFVSIGNTDLSPKQIRMHFHLHLQGPVIISIGSINENKDFSRSIQLVIELQKLCPSLNFFIGGSSRGQDLSTLLQQINKTPSPEKIVLLDRYLSHEEVNQAHRIADFSLLIYKVSTTSGAAVRSLCSGLPVICNDLPGFRAVVKDGWNGFLMGEDDPASEAKRIYEALQDPETLKVMKENALASYHGITWDQVALEHNIFYKKLLGLRF